MGKPIVTAPGPIDYDDDAPRMMEVPEKLMDGGDLDMEDTIMVMDRYGEIRQLTIDSLMDYVEDSLRLRNMGRPRD